MENNIMDTPGFWTMYGPHSDTVLSSRARLARNMHTLPFPNRIEDHEYDIIKSAEKRFAAESTYAPGLTILDLDGMDILEKRLLRERNLITYEMEVSENSSVILGKDHSFAILVNEEDHFRIQVIRPGFQLMEAFREADRVDSELNRFVPYAFTNELGYLSACPSNLGTGLKISAMLHLPILTLNGRMNELSASLKKSNVEVKGTMGHNSKPPGAIYQISNRSSLGVSEIDIVETMDGHVSRLIEHEDHERDIAISNDRLELEDMIWRSYGILKYSRKLGYVESVDNLSNVRLGIILAVIRNNTLADINDIMVKVQLSHLQHTAGREFASSSESDEFRAEYTRNRLK